MDSSGNPLLDQQLTYPTLSFVNGSKRNPEKDVTSSTSNEQPSENKIFVISREERLFQTGICFLASILPEKDQFPIEYLEDYKIVLAREGDMDFSTSTSFQIKNVKYIIFI